MQRRWWVFALLALAFAGGSPAAAQTEPPPPSDDVIAETTASVGLVTSSGFGTGWVVGQDSVITNFHVARTTETYFTPSSTGVRVRCYRAAAYREEDVALLKCPTGSLRPVPLRRERVRLGEAVAIIGYPGGEGPKVTTGSVTSERELVRDIPTIGVSAVAEPGSSGSPIIDERGRVLGVATFIGAGSVTNGVPTRKVRDLVDEAGYLPATQTAAEWRLRLIRSAVAGALAAALGAFLQYRSGYPGIGRRAARYALVAVLVALAATQFQLWYDGPVHFV